MIQFGMFGTTTRYGDDETMAKGAWVHVAESFGETLWGMSLAKGGTKHEDGSETREVSDLAAMLLDPESMFKARRPAKYLKRVPMLGKFTKTGKQRYRYFYHVGHAGGVHNREHMVAGASFAAGAKPEEHGHYTIHGVGHDGKLQVSHSGDPSKMESISHDDLHDRLIHAHADAYNEHHAKLKSDHKEALEAGNHKAAAKLRAEAEKIGYNPIHDGPIPSDPAATKKPEAGLGKYPEHQVRQLAREAKEAIDHHTKKDEPAHVTQARKDIVDATKVRDDYNWKARFPGGSLGKPPTEAAKKALDARKVIAEHEGVDPAFQSAVDAHVTAHPRGQDTSKEQRRALAIEASALDITPGEMRGFVKKRVDAMPAKDASSTGAKTDEGQAEPAKSPEAATKPAKRGEKERLDEALRDVPPMFANVVRSKLDIKGHPSNEAVIQHAEALGDAYRHAGKVESDLGKVAGGDKPKKLSFKDVSDPSKIKAIHDHNKQLESRIGEIKSKSALDQLDKHVDGMNDAADMRENIHNNAYAYRHPSEHDEIHADRVAKMNRLAAKARELGASEDAIKASTSALRNVDSAKELAAIKKLKAKTEKDPEKAKQYGPEFDKAIAHLTPKPADDTDWSGGGAPAKSKKEVDDAEAARLAKIPKTKVEHSIDKASSNISGIAWTPHPPDANKPGKGTMRVRFKGGDAYDYKDVHHDAYEAVRRGDVNGSHGETLNKVVRGNHESTKVAEGTRGTTPINTETADEMARKTRIKQRADADAAKGEKKAAAAKVEPAKAVEAAKDSKAAEPTKAAAAKSNLDETEDWTAGAKAHERNASRRWGYAMNAPSGTDMAESPYHHSLMDFWGDIGRKGKGFDEAFDAHEKRWRAHAEQNNEKVNRAPKIGGFNPNNPWTGASSIHHRWVSPDKAENERASLKSAHDAVKRGEVPSESGQGIKSKFAGRRSLGEPAAAEKPGAEAAKVEQSAAPGKAQTIRRGNSDYAVKFADGKMHAGFRSQSEADSYGRMMDQAHADAAAAAKVVAKPDAKPMAPHEFANGHTIAVEPSEGGFRVNHRGPSETYSKLHPTAEAANADATRHKGEVSARLTAEADAKRAEAAKPAKASEPAAPTRTNAEKLQATTERNQAAREAAKAEAPNHLANAQALYGMTDKDMEHVGKSGYAAKAAEHAAAGRHDEAKAHVRLAIKDRLTRDSNRNMSASAAERYLKDKEMQAAPKPVKAAKAPAAPKEAKAAAASPTPPTPPAPAVKEPAKEPKPAVHEGSSVHHGNVEYHVHSISNGDEGMDTTTVNPDGTRKTNDASVESSEANDKVPHANVTIVDHGKSIANPHRYGSKTIHEKEENHRIPVSQLQALADSGKGRVESKAEKSARIAKMTENESEMHGIDSDDHPMSGEGHIDAEHKFLHAGARLHNHETGARHEIKGVNKDGSVEMVTHMPRTAEEKRPTTADRAKVQPKTETMSKKAMEAYIDKNKKVLSLRGESDQNAKSEDTFNDLAARVKANPDHYLPASEDHIKAGRTVHTGNGMSYPINEHGKIDEDGEDLDLDGMRGHAFVEKSPAEIEAVKKQIPLFRALRAQLRQALRMAAPGIMSLAKNMRA